MPGKPSSNYGQDELTGNRRVRLVDATPQRIDPLTTWADFCQAYIAHTILGNAIETLQETYQDYNNWIVGSRIVPRALFVVPFCSGIFI